MLQRCHGSPSPRTCGADNLGRPAPCAPSRSEQDRRHRLDAVAPPLAPAPQGGRTRESRRRAPGVGGLRAVRPLPRPEQRRRDHPDGAGALRVVGRRAGCGAPLQPQVHGSATSVGTDRALIRPRDCCRPVFGSHELTVGDEGLHGGGSTEASGAPAVVRNDPFVQLGSGRPPSSDGISGCDEAPGLLHVYVDLILTETEGADDAARRYPGVAAHLVACGPCAEDLEGLLLAADPNARLGSQDDLR